MLLHTCRTARNGINPLLIYSSAFYSKKGAVLGVYTKGDAVEYTEFTESVNRSSSGKVFELLQYCGPIKEGKTKVLYGANKEYPAIAIVGLGQKDRDYNVLEERNDLKESVRTAVAAGCLALKTTEVSEIVCDSCGDGMAAAEGANLSLFSYQDLKAEKKSIPKVLCHSETNEAWMQGTVYAEGQNIARRLMETPANILTPTNFAQEAVSILEGLGVEVCVRSYDWAIQHKMNAFLSVSRGSVEPPVFLEVTYSGAGADTKPIALVGKGITFDAGGISLKPAANMDKMRADMGGAACVVGTLFIVSTLKMPVNIKGYIPLCENLPSGSANKPGDVVVASNGKSIQIDNTDAEGRLILADALHYASQHKPKAIIDMATLTGAMMVALGAGATGVFSNCQTLWDGIHKSGTITGDRMWRMPLWDLYSKQVTDSQLADVNNVGSKKSSGGSCTAASFLKQFVTCEHWMHLDIAGVMENTDEVPYLGKGMSGRPTRTVAHFLSTVT